MQSSRAAVTDGRVWLSSEFPGLVGAKTFPVSPPHPQVPLNLPLYTPVPPGGRRPEATQAPVPIRPVLTNFYQWIRGLWFLLYPLVIIQCCHCHRPSYVLAAPVCPGSQPQASDLA